MQSGSDLKGKVVGSVIDDKGNPIGDALIELHRGNSLVYETRTDEDRCFTVEDVDVGSYELVVNKSGYVQITEMVVISGGFLARFDSIVLEKTSDVSSEQSTYWMLVLAALAGSLMSIVAVYLLALRKRKNKEDEAWEASSYQDNISNLFGFAGM